MQPPRGAEVSSSLTGRLSTIVADILRLETIDPEESFLSYGANSIDLVRLGNRLEQELGTRPRIDALFRLQTVRELAGWYGEQLGDGDGNRATPEEPRTEIERIIASFRVFLDPVERDAFKDTDPAIRQDLAGQPATALARTDEQELVARYASRHATRQFSLKPIPIAAVAEMLECLRRVPVDGKLKYAYASAGGVYPNQVYLHVKPGRVEGLTAGTYTFTTPSQTTTT